MICHFAPFFGLIRRMNLHTHEQIAATMGAEFLLINKKLFSGEFDLCSFFFGASSWIELPYLSADEVVGAV